MEMEDQVAEPEAVEVEEVAEAEAETPEVEAGPEAATEPEAEEVEVTIGEESPPADEQPAPEWVRDLRKQYRELQRENRELKAKVAPQTPAIPALGAKPKLADHDYDEDAYSRALDAWYEQKREVDAAQERAKAAQAEEAKAWQSKLEGYAKAKAELKVSNFDDAEATAQEVFSVTQQGIILEAATNPALVVYALGRNPKKARELASIANPVKFTAELAKLEMSLKVNARKAAPPPEKTVVAKTSSGMSADSVLNKLREEADRTGDRSKVAAYLRQQRTK